MKRSSLSVGQAIFWISRVTRTGEARDRVPGYVINLTPKRISIVVKQTDGTDSLRHVTAKRLIPSTLAPILVSNRRKTMSNRILRDIRHRHEM